MKCYRACNHSRRSQAAAMTLVELMISVSLGTLLVALASSLWLFGGRSFVAMSNYTDLDAKSRASLDLMLREIREASAVTDFHNKGTTKWLSLTNAQTGTAITYTWDAGTGTLVCQKTGQPDQVYLTGCDRWDFDLFQRSPQQGASYAFFPATNLAGAYDLSICKLVNMDWKCSRTILGTKVNTESVQTAQVVLRNKQ